MQLEGKGKEVKRSQDVGFKLGEKSNGENMPMTEASFKKVTGNVSNKSNNGKIVTCYIYDRSHYMWNYPNRESLTVIVVNMDLRLTTKMELKG